MLMKADRKKLFRGFYLVKAVGKACFHLLYFLLFISIICKLKLQEKKV